MPHQPKNRRRFLEDSMFATAAAVAGVSKAFGDESDKASASPSDRLGVAVVGARGRGNSHIAAFAGRRDTQVLYVCDPDATVGERRAKEAAKRQRGRPVAHVEDFREALDDPRVDIVSIATPDHWQALAAIWSIHAGKDVYVEKPASHCFHEGRCLVQAARRHQRICQVGFQSRSSRGVREAMRFLHDEQLGALRHVRGLCFSRRSAIGPKVSQQPPPDLNYNLWLGPAPMANVTRQRFHHDWRWQWAYSGGELTNQGVHQLDIARWGMNPQTHPARVVSFGGRFGPPDAGETADTQTLIHEFPIADSDQRRRLVFEVRCLASKASKRGRGSKVGVIFETDGGFLVVARYTSAVAFDREGREIRTFAGGGDHFANFLRAVRTRKQADLNADVEEGHRSSALCHLANISYRLGRETSHECAEASLRRQGFDDDVVRGVQEIALHLRENGLQQDSPIRLGPTLAFDLARERFDSDEANLLLSREYRAPFVLPEPTDSV